MNKYTQMLMSNFQLRSFFLFFPVMVVFSCIRNLPSRPVVTHFKLSSSFRKPTKIFTKDRKFSEISTDNTNEFPSDSFISIKSDSDIYIDSTGRARTALYSNRIGKSPESSPVLVLNADYTPLSHAPLSLWCWQDALRAVFNDKATVVAEYKLIIRSVNFAIQLPSVIALKSFHKKPNNIPVMTRRYVFIRDGYRCQYCLGSFPAEKLSLDHVIPRSKGGLLTWTNTVCACHQCNFKKSDMLPEDLPRVGMKLRNMPRAPTYSEIQFKSKNFQQGRFYPDWEHFL